MFSLSSLSKPFRRRSKVGEGTLLEMEKIRDNDGLASDNQLKISRRYAERLGSVGGTREMSEEEKRYHDLFGVNSQTEECGHTKKTPRKKRNEAVQLSEVIFENNNDVEDNGGDTVLSVHTEDLTRRGITRKIASEIAFECRQWAKEDNERKEKQLKLKSGISDTPAQKLAKTGQYVNAESSDSNVQENVAESLCELAEEDIKVKKKKCSRKMKRKHRKINPLCDSTTGNDSVNPEPCPMKKPSDIYKMFQGTTSSDIHSREVPSIEPDDEYKQMEKANGEASSSAETTTTKTSKWSQFWKHGKTKVKKVKQPKKINEPNENEETTTKHKTSKFKFF
ncbi:uncharacterized protein LOC114531774 [Dendronephthya gigantea]|uniref:uncharacterized protein LOC114531774 n=1 Tax=Dendronephthya gigantea TaxID=151771 RepID=UPI00106B44B5|nr:uncharacterized protein LOC114531774 [Dendronephthya gigantea]